MPILETVRIGVQGLFSKSVRDNPRGFHQSVAVVKLYRTVLQSMPDSDGLNEFVLDFTEAVNSVFKELQDDPVDSGALPSNESNLKKVYRLVQIAPGIQPDSFREDMTAKRDDTTRRKQILRTESKITRQKRESLGRTDSAGAGGITVTVFIRPQDIFLQQGQTFCKFPCQPTEDLDSLMWRVNKWHLHWGKTRIIDKSPYFYFKEDIEKVERWELRVLQPLSFETPLNTLRQPEPVLIVPLAAQSFLRLNILNLPPQRFCNLWKPASIASRSYLLKDLHGVLQNSAEMEGQIQGKQLNVGVRRLDQALETTFKQFTWTEALEMWQKMYDDAIMIIVELEAEAISFPIPTLSGLVNSNVQEVSSPISTPEIDMTGFQSKNLSSRTLVAEPHGSGTTSEADLPAVQAGPVDSNVHEVSSPISTPAISMTGFQSKNLSSRTLVAEPHGSGTTSEADLPPVQAGPFNSKVHEVSSPISTPEIAMTGFQSRSLSSRTLVAEPHVLGTTSKADLPAVQAGPFNGVSSPILTPTPVIATTAFQSQKLSSGTLAAKHVSGNANKVAPPVVQGPGFIRRAWNWATRRQ
ncbi:hypothetical protein C8J56DRAFT_1172532 [Mycena floridula]|nr:hypothetical protein C8J56DRAFT_1172532 [Mycena floridula]